MKTPKFVDRSTDKFLSHKHWREQLQILVRGYSFNEAANLARQGMIKDRAWLAFTRVWEWASFHFSSDKQERFYQTYGKQAFYEKINKTRAAFGFPPINA